MLPDRVSNPRPLTYESGALPIALCGPAPTHEIVRKNVIFAFTFSIGIIHYDICLPCMQTIILQNSAYSVEKKCNYAM